MHTLTFRSSFLHLIGPMVLGGLVSKLILMAAEWPVSNPIQFVGSYLVLAGSVFTVLALQELALWYIGRKRQLGSLA